MSELDRLEQLKKARPDLYGEKTPAPRRAWESVTRFLSMAVLLVVLASSGWVGYQNRDFFSVGSEKSFMPGIFSGQAKDNDTGRSSERSRIKPIFGIGREFDEDEIADRIREQTRNY